MLLADHEVMTEEVKAWEGVHLLHFQTSSCSQKVRILLAEKGVHYVSHPVNLPRQQHVTPWFLGINPRGVVPVLVHDGSVHIESNDILAYIDRDLPSRAASYFAQDEEERALVKASLALEDSLHLDLRNITMGFVFPAAAARKSDKTLENYETAGAPNASRDKEVAWWRAFSRDGGVTEDALVRSLDGFRQAFDGLERTLVMHPWLIGDRISVLEVAWFISIHRLVMAGYPIEAHPRLAAHYRNLLARDSFANEVDPGAPMRWVIGAYGAYRRLRGTTLGDFALTHRAHS